MSDFHNPYNFVPFLDREKLAGGASDHPLGDRPGPDHGRLESDLYTGTISIDAAVRTPLLVPDMTDTDDQGHRIAGTRQGTGNSVHLPVTTLKGALRSAYESLTNSRMGVFSHDLPLARRMTSTEARADTVGVVLQHTDGSWWATVYPEVLRLPTDVPLAADVQDRVAGRGGWDAIDALHGHSVRARTSGSGAGAKVTEILGVGESSTGAGRSGVVCATGRNFTGKKSERFFTGAPESILLPADAIDRLVALLRSYEDQGHEGSGPGDGLEWSRHLRDCQSYLHERDLRRDVPLYLFGDGRGRLDRDRPNLRPVTMSRRTFTDTPDDLVPPSVLPATSFDELSPADRVFGWVAPAASDLDRDGTRAYAGNVRIQVEVDRGPEAPPGGTRTLPELSSPKPSYTRFYLGSADGWALPDGAGGSARPDFRRGETSLRGRKVYPPQRQVLHRPGVEVSKRNRTIESWLPAGAKVSVKLHIQNVSAEELGALLAVFELASDAGDGRSGFLKVGGGKPLGYGSIQFDLSSLVLDVHEGSAWASAYREAREPATSDIGEELRETLTRRFWSAMASAYGDDLGASPLDSRWGRALLAAFCGWDDDLPVDYPRTDEGQPSFEWFVENERTSGAQTSLPDLGSTASLSRDPHRR